MNTVQIKDQQVIVASGSADSREIGLADSFSELATWNESEHLGLLPPHRIVRDEYTGENNTALSQIVLIPEGMSKGCIDRLLRELWVAATIRKFNLNIPQQTISIYASTNPDAARTKEIEWDAQLFYVERGSHKALPEIVWRDGVEFRGAGHFIYDKSIFLAPHRIVRDEMGGGIRKEQVYQWVVVPRELPKPELKQLLEMLLTQALERRGFKYRKQADVVFIDVYYEDQDPTVELHKGSLYYNEDLKSPTLYLPGDTANVDRGTRPEG